MSNLTFHGMNADMQILGATQRFVYTTDDPVVKFQQYSQYAPTPLVDSLICIETRNQNNSGFRWKHTLKSTDVNSFGTFKFQSFVSDDAGTDLFGYDGGDFNYYKNIYFPNASNGRRVVFYEEGNHTTDYQFVGIGASYVSGSHMTYQVPQNNSHIFYEGNGVGSSTRNELVRFNSNEATFTRALYAKQPRGQISWLSNTTATVLSAGVTTKVLGTTTASSYNTAASMSGNNRLVFMPSDGSTRTIYAAVSATVDFSWGSVTPSLIVLSIYKNGSQLLPVGALTTYAASGGHYTLAVPENIISMTTGDYIELWVNSSVAAPGSEFAVRNATLLFKGG